MNYELILSIISLIKMSSEYYNLKEKKLKLYISNITNIFVLKNTFNGIYSVAKK